MITFDVRGFELLISSLVVVFGSIFGLIFVIMNLTKWLPRAFGLDFANPEVGQIWRCQWNGEEFIVSEIRIDDWGGLHVEVTDVRKDGKYAMQNEFAYGIDRWRRNLKAQRRELVTKEEAC